jgi:uncharacterized protein YceK
MKRQTLYPSFIVLGVALMFQTGCGTVWTMTHPKDTCSCDSVLVKPRYVYSGIRCAIDSARTCNIGGGLLLFDVPFSAVADTVALPVRLVQSATHASRDQANVTSGQARIIGMFKGDIVEAQIVGGTWYRDDHVTCMDSAGRTVLFTATVHSVYVSGIMHLSTKNAARGQFQVGDVISCSTK